MKYFFHFFLLTLCFQACKNPSEQQQPSGKYINISGTRVMIIAPPGFEQKNNYVGLMRDENAGIGANEYAGSFYEFGLTLEEQIERKGGSILKSEPLKIDGYHGRLLQIQIDQNIKAYTLVFGDSTFCATLFGSYNAMDEETGAQIKAALQHVKYDKTLTIAEAQPLFHLNDSISRLKLARAASNNFVYAIDGVAKNEYGTEPHLIVNLVPYDKKSLPQYLVKLMLETTAGAGFQNMEVRNESTADINGYMAYECELHAMYQGVETLVYLGAVVSGDKAVTFQGPSYSDFEATMAEYKKLAHTIRIKE